MNLLHAIPIKTFALSLTLAVTLAGCAKGGGSGDSQAASCGSKAIASSWIRNSDSAVFNLTGLVFGITNQFYMSGGGTTCRVDLRANGNQCSGTYSITNAVWMGDGGADPGCSGLNETGTFSKSDSGLSICTNGTLCKSYR